MSTTFLPGADDHLRERVAVEIARLQVRRALRDASHATGHSQDKRGEAAACAHTPATGFLTGAVNSAPVDSAQRKQ